MAGEIRAYDRLGNKITVSKEEVGQLYALGGKVATRADQDAHDAETRQAEREEKAGIGGTIQTAVGAYAGALNPLMYTGGPGTSGEAYNRGVTHGATAGLSEVAERKAIDATAGPGAGAKFAQQLDDVKTTSPYAHGAGEMMGLVGGTALGASTPAGAIGRIGGLAEGGANALTKGLAARGALGKAAATGIGYGVRGAVEGGVYAGATSATDDLVHDNEVNGEKLYTAIGHGALAGGAIGGGLGFTGSLAASGVKAAKGAIISKLATAGAEGGATSKFGDALSGKGARKMSDELAVDALGATKTQSVSALEYVKGGKAAVGEYVNRVAIRPPGNEAGAIAGAARAAWEGHPSDILAKVQTDKASRIIPGLDEAINAAPTRIAVDDISKAVNAHHAEMLKDPTRIAGADAFQSRIALELQALENAGKVGADRTVGAVDMYRFRASLEGKAYEVGRASGAAGDAYKGFLRDLDKRIVGAIDESARLAGDTTAGERIRFWKREYQLASAAEEMASHGVERYGGNNIFGIREATGAAVALGTGHPIGAATTLLGGKVLRERGAAAGAYALGRLADRQATAQAMRAANEMRTAAVKGLLSEAPAATSAGGKAPKAKVHTVEASQGETVALRSQADAIMQWQGQVRANPKRMMDALSEAAEVVGRTAGPRTASAYTSATLRAFNYISRYVPVKDRRDPLDPSSVPPLTYDEADRLVRAHKYATEPGAVWADFGRGVITPEGLDWANEVPEQFAQFRMELLAEVTEHMLRKKQISDAHRLRIDKLLGTPAGPDLRPDAIARHQQDFLDKVPDDASGPQPPQTGGQPVNMKISQAGFDAVEARKSG